MLFRVAPYVSFAASYTAYLALPFADGWVAFDTNVAVFFILAVLGPGSLRRHPGRLRVGFEMVVVRGHA